MNLTIQSSPLSGWRRWLILAAGLLILSLIAGLWLLPALSAQSSEPDPGLILSAADTFWRFRDVERARESLAGWNEIALAETLALLRSQAASLQSRIRLLALREGLALPRLEPSLFDRLWSQKAVLWSAILTLLPLLAAGALTIGPPDWTRLQALLRPQSQEELQPAAASGASATGRQAGQPAGQPVSPPAARPRPGSDQPDAPAPPADEEADQVKVRAITAEEATVGAEAPDLDDQAPLTEEQKTEQVVQTSEQLEEMGAHFGDMVANLQRLQQQAPQMQLPLANLQAQLQQAQEHLQHLQGNVGAAPADSVTTEMGAVQDSLSSMLQQMAQLYEDLPADAPPELRAELEHIMSQVQEEIARLHAQMAQVQRLAPQAADQSALDGLADDDDLVSSGLLDDILSSIFEEEEEIDPHLEALCAGLNPIDIEELATLSTNVYRELKEIR